MSSQCMACLDSVVRSDKIWGEWKGEEEEGAVVQGLVLFFCWGFFDWFGFLVFF